MNELARSLAAAPRAITVFGAPEGHDAATIGSAIRAGAAESWLHVCRDDGRMASFAAALGFFHPELDVLTFPAWDCLPYDRVSPNGEITSRRIDTLTRLAEGVPSEPSPSMGEGLGGGDAAKASLSGDGRKRQKHPLPGPPPSRGRGTAVVLTTVNALVQRVPPRKLFDGRVLTLGKGGKIPLDRLQSFFGNNGYNRT